MRMTEELRLFAFARNRWPTADVHETLDGDHFVVSVRVSKKQLIADRAQEKVETLRALRERLTARPARVRRLHWGRVRARKGVLRFVLSVGGWPQYMERAELGAP